MKKQLSTLELIYANYARATRNRPSALRSTLYFGPMGWVARWMGSLVFFAGLIFIVAGWLTQPDCKLPDLLCGTCHEKFDWAFLAKYPAFLGICLSLIGFFMNLSGRMCRRILIRNFYIMELEDIFDRYADEREEEEEEGMANDKKKK